nr:immunoglobulin light chain junction region [Macaca mulatta]
CMQSTKDLTF